MSELGETTILQDGPVKITNRRALIGTISYSMTEIKSARVIKGARDFRSLWLALIGVLLISWSILDQTGYYREFFNIGIVLIILGVGVTLVAKPTFTVQVNGAAGERGILGSTNPAYVKKIADAINQAITGKVERV